MSGPTSQPNWRALGAGLMVVGIAAGAFGAHALTDTVSPELLSAWKTGANYHLLTALALFSLGSWPQAPKIGGWLLVIGLVLFSGSLYAMTLTGLTWLGAITPLGGLAFMAGWTALAVKATRAPPKSGQ